MISDADFRRLMDWTEDIEFRLRRIEDNSRLAASTVQPLVGPPNVNQGEPAALARPATLSEIVSFVEGMMIEYKTDRASGRFEQGVVAACEAILQRLGTLDQGTIAQCPSEDEIDSKGYANQFDNRI